MTTIGQVFIPLNREHDGTVPKKADRAHFETLLMPLAAWQPFEQRLADRLSELSDGVIDRDDIPVRSRARQCHDCRGRGGSSPRRARAA